MGSRADSLVAHMDAGQEKLTQADIAYNHLKSLILDGSLRAGAQLLELEAASKLQMSRTPVREAMVRLRQDGMVDIRPRHGMRVLPVSADDMREIYQVLTGLEVAAVSIVCERGLDLQELQALEDAVVAMNEALEKDDLASWAAADEDFHSLLVNFSCNRRLIGMVEQLWDQSHRARMVTLRLRPKPISSSREHQELLDAIARRDATLAQKIHGEHRKRAGAMLVSILQDYGLNQV